MPGKLELGKLFDTGLAKEKQIAEFRLIGEMSHSYRYEEIIGNQTPIFGILYITKDVTGRYPPEKIRVTLEPA